MDTIQRNKEALKNQYDIPNEKRIMNTLKQLPPGGSFTFPDGTVVLADEILEGRAPRKVVLLGDTSDAGAIAPLAMGANVLVHEATNAWFPAVERNE